MKWGEVKTYLTLFSFLLFQEFLSLKDFYEEFEIERYSTRSPIKSSFAERANKTIEDLLFKIMTARNTAKWTDLLDDVVRIHNHRVSSVLHGLTPFEAHQLENEEFLRKKFLADYEKHKNKFVGQKPKFAIGDTVRLVRKQKTFSRGYEPTFEREIHVVKDVLLTYPITYKIEGKQRAYYTQELVKAAKAETPLEKNYFIEKTRKINVKKLRSGASAGGETQYLLKAKNDPDQSSWISEFEFRSLKDGGYLE